MKVVLISILTLVASCFISSDQSVREGNIIHTQGENFALFLNKDTKDLYLIQFEKNIQVPEDAKFIEYKKEGRFVIQDLKINKPVTYLLGNNSVFGIVRMQGTGYLNSLTTTNGENIGFISNIDDVIYEVACGCQSVFTSTSSCDSGGAGASSCSTSSGGDSCSVSCNSGMNACCSNS